MKVTSATMLALSAAFPIAAATAIRKKYILYNQVGSLHVPHQKY